MTPVSPRFLLLLGRDFFFDSKCGELTEAGTFAPSPRAEVLMSIIPGFSLIVLESRRGV